MNGEETKREKKKWKCSKKTGIARTWVNRKKWMYLMNECERNWMCSWHKKLHTETTQKYTGWKLSRKTKEGERATGKWGKVEKLRGNLWLWTSCQGSWKITKLNVNIASIRSSTLASAINCFHRFLLLNVFTIEFPFVQESIFNVESILVPFNCQVLFYWF